ncbi:hypothetical protein N799_12535 [Lysobacter arseniciresistens ZS79]|uniref:Mth938-like domain-containing protein n=1 Tax=Lysobacter arseniciresistens ZS79 TaxID=913325 RepID=A0A0A0F1H8_9GAMM|nr:Mth938-like domain-containing protein [Lysobacter arseniciresistens]KGM57021.1 hypothetical protein N799_12535 [Lysobacter arseniciresistens ZS79]
MQLTLERPDHEFFLRGADGAVARVNDLQLTRSFVIAPDRLLRDWAATGAAAMTPEMLEPLLEMAPAVILLGTGERQVFPSPAVLAEGLRRGVGIEVMTNAAAARTFNVLAGEGRKVVAGFILPA